MRIVLVARRRKTSIGSKAAGRRHHVVRIAIVIPGIKGEEIRYRTFVAGGAFTAIAIVHVVVCVCVVCHGHGRVRWMQIQNEWEQLGSLFGLEKDTTQK